MSSRDHVTDQEVARLGKIELFHNLTPEQVQAVLTCSKKMRFCQNEIIMKEGEEGNSIYLVMEGTVEVARRLVLEGIEENGDIANKVFTKLNAEDHPVFGEISLLEESKRTATIRALTDCLFYKITRDELLKLTREDHELGCHIFMNLARIVSSRLRKADEDIVKLTTVLSIVLKEGV